MTWILAISTINKSNTKNIKKVSFFLNSEQGFGLELYFQPLTFLLVTA